MKNVELAYQLLTSLKRWGVEEVCICPGGRNAPLIEVLDKSHLFKIHSAFDERSAGFFALGRVRAGQKPVAVITTSGTAAAELLPSVIEAYYSSAPLIVITADRPYKMRGVGSPQVIEQSQLFKNFVEKSLDIEGRWEGSLSSWTCRQPLHINIGFDEPLIDGELPQRTVDKPPHLMPASPLMYWQQKELQLVSLRDLLDSMGVFLSKSKSPLLLVSQIEDQDVERIEKFIKIWPGYMYIEGTSGLREMNHPHQLLSGDSYLCQILGQGKIDGVLRIGGVPTTRLWRDLENSMVPTLSLSHRPFPGLSKGSFFWLDYKWLGDLALQVQSSSILLDKEIVNKDRELQEKSITLLAKYPRSEPAWMQWLSQQIRPEDGVYVGNSLPIREWDLFAQSKAPIKIAASRGANGIDGQVATAIGSIVGQKTMWAVLGDLTTLYDSNGLWFWRPEMSFKLVVINNGGGKIFQRMFNSSLFYNEHKMNFSAVAAQWQMPYYQMSQAQELPADSSFLLEIHPDEEQTKLFWQEYDPLFKG